MEPTNAAIELLPAVTRGPQEKQQREVANFLVPTGPEIWTQFLLLKSYSFEAKCYKWDLPVRACTGMEQRNPLCVWFPDDWKKITTAISTAKKSAKIATAISSVFRWYSIWQTHNQNAKVLFLWFISVRTSVLNVMCTEAKRAKLLSLNDTMLGPQMGNMQNIWGAFTVHHWKPRKIPDPTVCELFLESCSLLVTWMGAAGTHILLDASFSVRK